MTDPVYLYVYGKTGGPFKVGYSNAPKTRTMALRIYPPASVLGGPSAIMQHVALAGTPGQAREAERAAHAILATNRLPRSANPHAGHYSSPIEWFAVPLGEAVAAVDQAVRPIGATDA